MSIKEIVFAYIHLNNGVIIYEELEAYVLSYKPGSAWNKSHWNYYRSNITSSNGRYYHEFSEIERRNLKEQAGPGKEIQLKNIPAHILENIF